MKMTKKKKAEVMATIKRHFFSALITFISAFLLFVGSELVLDSLSSPEALYALLAGAAMAGMRALIKILNEELVVRK